MRRNIHPECVEVMNLVIKIIANRLSHRQFCSLLEEVDNADLLLHNKVWWLSRRGAETLRYMSRACENLEGFRYPELEDLDCLGKFYFMVDMTSHLNTLNKTLQVKGSTALQTLENVLAFERKMTVFARDGQKGTFSHFPSLREFKKANNQKNYDYSHRAIIASSKPDLEIELANIVDKDLNKFKTLTAG